MNFWKKRTELEKTLLLMLCITIPVNGILIYMYSYFMKHYPKDGSGSDYKTSSEISNDLGPKFDVGPHTLIGSVSHRSQINRSELIFQCPAFIIQELWIITYINCIKKNDVVRVSSKFWFRGGYKRKIIRVETDTDYNYSLGELDKPLIKSEHPLILSQFLESWEKPKEFDTYRWNTTFTNNDDDAKKYNKLRKLHFNVTSCTRLHDGFCALENKSSLMSDWNYSKRRGPAFKTGTASYTLLGLEVYREDREDQVEHFYTRLIKNNFFKYIDFD